MWLKALWRSSRERVTAQLVWGFVAGGLIFGLLGWYLSCLIAVPKDTGAVLLQNSNFNNYKYIDPLLTCEIGDQETFTELASMKETLASTVHEAVANGVATGASVYYRSLKNAHWFDINPTEGYAPASLLKTFVMMAFYKESRDLNEPNLLNRQILFKGSDNPAADEPGAVIPHLANNQLYTINDVIKQMIVYSDNDALNTLTDNFDPITTQNLSEIFSDLQIDSPLTNDPTYLITVDQYAKVFRVLYTSTYLSRRLSEQALTLLSQAQFKLGIVGGVPKGVEVAHKFGDAIVPASPNDHSASSELHDCGIVYYPDEPYILCVMTKGSDFSALSALIQTLSKEAYAEVERLYPKGR